jgi:hypothetical protein
MRRRSLRELVALRPIAWRRSNRILLATFFGLLAVVYIFILLVDPYGVVPFSLPIEREIVSSQRQMFPQILRTGRYDSILVGDSTARLLDPQALDRALGGHFASFSMPSMTAWEQIQVIDFFRRTVAIPRAVLIGLDHEWCDRAAGAHGRDAGFPSWAYDDNPWNDFLYLLNAVTLETAGRTVGRLIDLYPEKLRADGFEIFVPPESTYDYANAHVRLWGQGGPAPGPRPPPMVLSEAERSVIVFPTLPWLDQGLAELPGSTRKLLFFTPVHVLAQPSPGSYLEAVESECKARIADLARRRGAILVDWRIASALTTEATNYWDWLHYRLPIAYRMIDDLDHIVAEGRESPDASYRILVR